MSKQPTAIWIVLTAVLLVSSGCFLRKTEPRFGAEDEYFHTVATELDYPDVPPEQAPEELAPIAPFTLGQEEPPEYWDLALEEVVHIAISNSETLREVGAAVLRAPDTVATKHDPALRETDPRFGVEAALAAFDAQFSARAFGEKNDRALNNILLGGGTRVLKQDLFVFEAGIVKPTAVGGQFAVRKNIDYDFNNAPGNRFPGAWNTILEAEARQSLLQGAGVAFNRIAGPNNIAGVYNGVLIARISTDIELTELETALRNLVTNVENAYWDLYFAYRDLEARKAARDAALETWRRVSTQVEQGLLRADQEHQAREQYFRFQQEVENALTGRLVEGTRTNNGSSGGTFRGAGGVHVAERRLRLLTGLPLTDGRLIRPAEEPKLVRVVFDWNEVTSEALARRAELRRQKWQIKRRELELVASRNFLLPELDATARYRWRGFGKDLIDANSHLGGRPRFDNAFMNLTSGDFQEWQLGLELSVPLGFRRGHAAVRNAELGLARARTVLREQERQVVHDVAGAIAELERAFHVAQTAYSRRVAASEQLRALEALGNEAPVDRVLEAQRRWAESDTDFHRALVEYMLAIKNVHFEKGSLLDHCQVFLAEGPWPEKAYRDAARRERTRGRPKQISYILKQPITVGQGPYFQEAELNAAHLEFESILPHDAGKGETQEQLPPPEELVPPEATDTGASLQRQPSGTLSRSVVQDAARSVAIRLPHSKSRSQVAAGTPPMPQGEEAIVGPIDQVMKKGLSFVGAQTNGSRIRRSSQRIARGQVLDEREAPGGQPRGVFTRFVGQPSTAVIEKMPAEAYRAASRSGQTITRPVEFPQSSRSTTPARSTFSSVVAETVSPTQPATASFPPFDAPSKMQVPSAGHGVASRDGTASQETRPVAHVLPAALQDRTRASELLPSEALPATDYRVKPPKLRR